MQIQVKTEHLTRMAPNMIFELIGCNQGVNRGLLVTLEVIGCNEGANWGLCLRGVWGAFWRANPNSN